MSNYKKPLHRTKGSSVLSRGICKHQQLSGLCSITSLMIASTALVSKKFFLLPQFAGAVMTTKSAFQP